MIKKLIYFSKAKQSAGKTFPSNKGIDSVLNSNCCSFMTQNEQTLHRKMKSHGAIKNYLEDLRFEHLNKLIRFSL
jgi:hypothetical protein